MTDNQALRDLFTLPPLASGSSTALTLPATPAPQVVTGDRELDAVLWLRDCIKTAHPALIGKALEAFKAIKTPAKDLETRYTDYVRRVSNGHFAAVLMTFGFADLEKLAARTIEHERRRQESLSRFGSVEQAFKDTKPEAACKKVLRGLKRSKDWDNYDAEAAEPRFAAAANLVPATLSDCLYCIGYWDDLYRLRAALNDGCGDPHPAGRAQDDYCFDMLAKLKPCTREESLAVFEHLQHDGKMGWKDTPAILRNLIAGGWQ